MSTSAFRNGEPRAVRVKVTRSEVVVDLSDGRTVSAPLAWYPRLLHGTQGERHNWRLVAGGSGINWPDLDEDLSVDGLLDGRTSSESQASLKKWLSARSRGRVRRRIHMPVRRSPRK